ncbi:MAG: sensor histidine kinase, partial [Lachnospiraceae bacterium]|nr:sensor histidine kinase [Lachnospiraceae bacterium]
MTIREFLSDRLGKMILQLCAATAAVVFLLATGTSPGVIIILLLFFLLIYMITQISGDLNCRSRRS